MYKVYKKKNNLRFINDDELKKMNIQQIFSQVYLTYMTN